MAMYILFCRDDRSLWLEETKKEIEVEVESIDVLDGNYDVFDEMGNMYELFVNDAGRPEIGRVVDSKPGVLLKHLKQYFQEYRLSPIEVLEIFTLSELVELLRKP